MKEKLSKSSFLRLFKLLGKRKFIYLIGIIVLSCDMLIMNSICAYTLNGLSNAIIKKDMSILINTVGLLGIAVILISLILPFFSYMFESSIKVTMGKIRKTLFIHIQKLPVKYIENTHSGDLTSRLTNDIQAVENAYGNQLRMVLTAIISGVGSAIVIINIDYRFFILGIIAGTLTLLVNTSFIKPLKKISTKIQGKLSLLNQTMTDMLGGIEITKIFNLNKTLNEKYENINKSTLNFSLNRVLKNSFLSLINEFLNNLSFVGIIVIGFVMVSRGSITFSKLMAIVQMMNGIFMIFNTLGNFLTQLQASLAGADRVFEIIDMPVEEYNSNKALRVASPSTENNSVIEFNNVHFSYENNEEVLKGINLTLNQNQVLAIVGSSGGGKSTIFKILLKFYTSKSGDIRIFNKKIDEYSLDSLRKLIAYVPQDNYLFSGTIYDNIAYGNLDASEEEIYNAAKLANAHDFIISLPDGYDTEVGERGAHLSGGQRQRIAIARAVLKNAPILLLDEATSSLDSESEREVQKALDTLMEGRSTIVVAHRLSTIQNADKILVLQDGEIAEEGDHNALLKLNKFYARLYNTQFKTAAS